MTTDNEELENEHKDTLSSEDGEGEDTLPGDEGEEEENEEDTTEGGEDTTEGGDKGGEAKQGRAGSRIQRLAAENKAAREEARQEREARIRAEALAEERATARAGASNQDAARARQEKLDLMDPTERQNFLRDERLEQMEGRMLFAQLQTADIMDKNSYATNAKTNPVYARNSDEVEKRLKSERQAGRNWSREQILAQVVGEKALQAKPNTKGKNEAKERVERTRSNAPRTRSDAGTSYRPGKKDESFEDLEARLENVTF